MNYIRRTVTSCLENGYVKLPDFVKRNAHWFIRIPLAALLLYYGIGKFPGMIYEPSSFGVPPILFVLSTLGEVLGGLALLIGGLFESFRPKQKLVALFGDVVTRLGGLAGVFTIGGVILWFYIYNITLYDPYVMMFGLAVYFFVRGNKP